MSHDSNIWIETKDTPEQIQQVIERVTTMRRTYELDDLLTPASETTSASIASVLPLDVRPRRVGLACNQQIHICSKIKRSNQWTIDKVRIAVAMLHAGLGDLLFHYLYNPVMLRRNGRLILADFDGFWNPRYDPPVLGLVDLPFEWGDAGPGS